MVQREPKMSSRPARLPGPDHPISIAAEAGRVVVKVGGHAVADSRAVLTLREADYPPIFYIPRSDVDMSLLQRTKHVTYCPYKGKASYFSIAAGGDRATNAVWSYEDPYEAVREIKEHVAFYPDRVDSIERLPG